VCVCACACVCVHVCVHVRVCVRVCVLTQVSAMSCGLLPLCFDAMALGEVPFCDMDGDLQQLHTAIGSSSKVTLIVLSHCRLVLGSLKTILFVKSQCKQLGNLKHGIWMINQT